MKCIIAGGRNITQKHFLIEALQKSNFDISEVVSGGAPGIDTLAISWAYEHHKKNESISS